jgi:hypothetical protein
MELLATPGPPSGLGGSDFAGIWIVHCRSCRTRKWTARDKAVQHVRVKVHAIRPYNGAGLAFNTDLAKEVGPFERLEDPASPDDMVAQVDRARRTVRKGQV